MAIHRFVVAVSAFMALALVGPADATLLSGTITGQVVSTGGAVPGIGAGSSVSGSYTYDDASTYADFFGPVYAFETFSLVLGTNSHVFTLADLQTFTNAQPGVDLLHSTTTANDLYFFFSQSAAQYLGGGSVSGQTLGYVPQQFDFNNSNPALSFAFDFSASLGTPLVATPTVPEPRSLALLLIGMTGMIISRGRQAKSGGSPYREAIASPTARCRTRRLLPATALIPAP